MKNKVKSFLIIVLSLAIVASLTAVFFTANAENLLDNGTETESKNNSPQNDAVPEGVSAADNYEHQEGNLEKELYFLKLFDDNKQVIFENLEIILKSSQRYTEEGFIWAKNNINDSSNGTLIYSYVLTINAERTKKVVDVINDFLSIGKNADDIENQRKSTLGDPAPTGDSPEFTEAAKDLEAILNGSETYLGEKNSLQSYSGAIFRDQRGSYPETDTAYGVQSSDDVEGIKEAYKTVNELEKFRHMEVELSLVPKVLEDGQGEGAEADIVLVLDESTSMHGDKWKAVREVAAEVSRQIFIMSPKSKVGVVTYNSDLQGAFVVSYLKDKDQVEELVAAIMKRNNIRGYTNMQSGIIKARESVLGIDDSWTEADVKATGRKKILINLTDGMPNDPYTDLDHEWPTPDMTPTAHKRLKRWGKYVYAPGWGAANKIEVEGTRWFDNAIDQRTKDVWVLASTHQTGPLGGVAQELHGELAYVLESQYTVSKGIDVFAIDYSTDDYDMEGSVDPIEVQRRAKEVLKLSTYKMIDPPETFRYSPSLRDPSATSSEKLKIAELNPIKDSSFTSVGYEDRVYDAKNPEELLKAFEEILTVIKGKVPQYTVDDYFNDEIYEIVEQPVPSGGEMSSAVINVNGNHIQWISTGQSLEKRTVKYTLRVKDEPVYPDGVGRHNVGGPTTQGRLPTGAAAVLTFKNGAGLVQTYKYKVPVVSFERLIDGIAYATDKDGNILGSVFTDKLYLGGTITRGNGDYSFEWFYGPDDTGTPITSAPVDVSSTSSGFFLSILLDKIGPITDETAGSKIYTLKIYDDVATGDGYRSKGVSYILRTVEVEVVCGEVRITVKNIDELQKTRGLFETRVSKGLESQVTADYDNWYFLGPDTKVYSVGLFVDPNATAVSGGSTIMTAQTYIPYGYKLEVVKADSVLPGNIGVINILPIKSGGSWSLPSKEIIIEVKKIEQKFFYDWAWGPGKSDTVIFNKETTVK